MIWSILKLIVILIIPAYFIGWWLYCLVMLPKDIRTQRKMREALYKAILEGLPIIISFNKRRVARRQGGERDFVHARARYGMSQMQIEKEAKALLEKKYPFHKITEVRCEW